ncbi:MAG: NAD-dependent epimerase/dehydratase family protein [Patescibacteria group bacterium]
MKKILITGSSGNIGAYITAKIQKLLPETELIRTVYGQENVSVSEGKYTGDLRDPHVAEKIFQDHPDVDCIIHAAASAYNTDKFKEQPLDILRNDTLCLLNVLGQAKSPKLKIIYLSSVMVYESVQELPFTEDSTNTNPAPVTPYGIAKFLGEKAVRLYSEQNKSDFTIWRLFNVVSPLENHIKSGGHVYVDFYRKLFVERLPTIKIFGNGQQVRCFTWVEDIAEPIVNFLDDPHTSRETFNLGGKEPKSLIDLAETLLSIGHEKGLLPHDYAPTIKTGGTFNGLDVGKRIPSLEKVEKDLNWTAPTVFRKIFEKFVDAKQKYAHK